MTALIETYAKFPITAQRGEDVYIYDASGTRYLDLYGGHAVALIGHSPPAVAEAIAAQAQQLLFYSNVVDVPVREEAAELLMQYYNRPEAKVFFCNSGAEANENALKLALKLTGRSKFIAFKGSFHGRSFLASRVTDHPSWHTETGAWSGPVEFLDANETAQLSQIDAATACVILEPIQSMAGVIEFAPEYLAALRSRCTEVGAYLIFDEVQTGMGRTGTPFLSGAADIWPDFTTLAKGIAGGVPLGALIASGEIANKLKSGDLGSTFGGGPLAMAALRATVQTLTRERLHQSAARFEQEIRSRCTGGIVTGVLGKGCLLGIKLSVPAKELQKSLLEHRIITGTSNDPSVLRLMPPLTAQPSHAAEFAASLAQIGGSI